MFESTLSAQALDGSERRLGPLSAAVAGHLALVSAIVCVAALIVPPIKDANPPPPPGFIKVLLPPNPEPLRSGASQPIKGTERSRPHRSVARQPPVQPPVPPVETPETLSTTTAGDGSDDSDAPGDGTPGLPDGSGSDLTRNMGVDDGGGPHGDGTGPVPLSAEMVKPVLIVKVEPGYPDVARRARLPGRVIVQAVIGRDGSVESAEILSSTNPLFNDAAKSAVSRWRYRPALMNGTPVRIYFTVVVDFSVR